MKNTRRLLSRFFLILQFLLLTTCFYSMNGCSSGEVKRTISPGLDADYLVLNEKILMNFFGSSDEKDWAMKTLETRCEDNLDPHACYNLATHLFSIKNFQGAAKYSELATLQNPEDDLYKEMYRHAILEVEKFENSDKKSLPISEISFHITKLESLCRQNNSELAFTQTSELINQNILTIESIKNGFISECLSKEMINELSSKSPKNKVYYPNLYYAEKNKTNSFNSVWDTSYLTKNTTIEKEEVKVKLTQHWKAFRNAVSVKNERLARKSLAEFIGELNQEKVNSKRDANILLAIERAAKLLIEQDNFFTKYKHLANEL